MENITDLLCLALGALVIVVAFLISLLLAVLRQLEHTTTQLALLRTQEGTNGSGCGGLVALVVLITLILVLIGPMLH